MINHGERSAAKNVARGCPVNHDKMSVKAEAYGTFAGHVLAEVSLGAIAQDMAQLQTAQINEVVGRYTELLNDQGADILNKRMGYHESRKLNDLFNRLGEDGYDVPPSSIIARERFATGIDMATLAYGATFRTLAHRTQRGDELTQRGLAMSWRVPYLLTQSYENGVRPTVHNLTEVLSEPLHTNSGETVFIDALVPMDPIEGLLLDRKHVYDPGEDITESMPHLGCPSTLLPHFVQSSFGIMAEAATRNGLISVV